ncbi:MAG: hypothetical protein HY549_09100 [Elusimicrobia bacterium]|nr:hypothetical protein [Elusimicrobiota bacterium]
MNLLLPVIFLLLPCRAGEAPDDVKQDVRLISHVSPYWLRTYSLSPYEEHWSLSIKVRDIKRDLPKILNEFERTKAQLAIPLENLAASSKTQQLSYRIGLVLADQVVKKLKKIGQLSEPRVRRIGEQASSEEIKDKINRLISEKTAHGKQLANMPNVSAVIDELLEHLLVVEAITDRRSQQLLFNLSVEEAH